MSNSEVDPVVTVPPTRPDPLTTTTGHPIHPTSSTSTHPPATMDGPIRDIRPELERLAAAGDWTAVLAAQRRLNAEVVDTLHRQRTTVGERGPELPRPDAYADPNEATQTTNHATSSRPVTLSVACCCDSHQAVGCCDPDDCGPCCEYCPTCPTVASWSRSFPVGEQAVGDVDALAAWVCREACGRLGRQGRHDPFCVTLRQLRVELHRVEGDLAVVVHEATAARAALASAGVRWCRGCGCTDDDCSACLERTGTRCAWCEPLDVVANLCTACLP